MMGEWNLVLTPWPFSSWFISKYTGCLSIGSGFGCIWNEQQTPHFFFSSFLCFLIKVLEKTLWDMQDDESLWLAYTQEPNRAFSKLGTEVQLHGSRNRCCEYSTHISCLYHFLISCLISAAAPTFLCLQFSKVAGQLHFQQKYPRF